MFTFRLISVRAAEGGEPVGQGYHDVDGLGGDAVFEHARGFVSHREYRSTHDIGIAEFASLDAFAPGRCVDEFVNGWIWVQVGGPLHVAVPPLARLLPKTVLLAEPVGDLDVVRCPGWCCAAALCRMRQAMSRPDKSATRKGRRGAASLSQKPPVNQAAMPSRPRVNVDAVLGHVVE